MQENTTTAVFGNFWWAKCWGQLLMREDRTELKTKLFAIPAYQIRLLFLAFWIASSLLCT